MSTASWDEIKRLAADFQRAQLNTTVQRLSERNCVEIIWKLKELNLLELIYTTDGKEYITPQELSKEIREELIVHGGRVGIVEIAQSLNIDFACVEAKVTEIVRSDRNLSIILGQLIDHSYYDRIAEEINDRLQEYGLVTIADLTKEYNLPGDVLTQVVQEHLGSTIKGQVDPRDRGNIFTEQYVERNRARVRGALCAVTRPINVGIIMHAAGIQEGLFYSILDDLLSSGQLAGSITGSRTDKAQFVPDIYTRAQNEWVESFYAQNGYLEYDTMSRLGISDPASYVRKKFKNEKILYLTSCCVGYALTDRLEAEVDEILSSNSWTDVMPLVPSVLSPNDVNQLLQTCIKSKSGVRIMCDSVVISQQLVHDVANTFDADIHSKAERDIVANPALLSSAAGKSSQGSGDKSQAKGDDKKEQRRQKAGGSSKSASGAGSHGREVRTKAVKKKPRGAKDANDSDDNDDDEGTSSSTKVKGDELEYLPVDAIEAKLKAHATLKEAPADMLTELAESLYRPLNRQYQDALKSVFLQTSGTATSSSRRKLHAELSEKIVSLWTNICLFSKSFSQFSDELQQLLVKHLLKTLCTDLTNAVFQAFATDSLVSASADNEPTPEFRNSLLAKMTDEKAKAVLTKLNLSLVGKNLDEFLQHVDDVCGGSLLNISLKKPDKKKERQLVFSHRQALLEQLNSEAHLAAALHLTCVVLFEAFTQCMLHMPGRLVPQLIAFLKEHLATEHLSLLSQCQDVVVKQMKGGEVSPTADSASIPDSAELVTKLRHVAATVKKSTKQQSTADKDE